MKIDHGLYISSKNKTKKGIPIPIGQIGREKKRIIDKKRET